MITEPQTNLDAHPSQKRSSQKRSGCGRWSIVLATVAAVLFGGLTAGLLFISSGLPHEYGTHINFAVQMFKDGEIKTPHFLYQILTISNYLMISPLHIGGILATSPNLELPLAWVIAGFLAITEIYILIALCQAWWMSNYFERNSAYHGPAGYFISLCLMIAWPILLPKYLSQYYYLGYIPPSNLYIIPTQTTLKLTTLLMFVLSARIFIEVMSKRSIALLCLATVLCGLSKPSGLLALLPALWLLAGSAWLARKRFDLRALLIVSAISLAVLLWQFYFKFVSTTAPVYRSSIIITEPFAVYRHYSDLLPLKFLLSVLFPVYVLATYRKLAWADPYVRYAVIVFVIGLLTAGFLGESPPHLYAGNFTWSAQIGCFVLFLATTAYFFSQAIMAPKRQPAIIVGYILFGMHIAAGIFYYIHSYSFAYF